jgi:hypothetical protein
MAVLRNADQLVIVTSCRQAVTGEPRRYRAALAGLGYGAAGGMGPGCSGGKVTRFARHTAAPAGSPVSV